MVRVLFPAVLQRHIACPPVDVDGGTVAAALATAFASQPALRGYLLDEHGAMRPHVTAFVDGEVLRDRERLSDPVRPSSVIEILQALSGG
jgi:sulfur-carrier protein